MTAYPLSIPICTAELQPTTGDIRLQATVIPVTCGPGSTTIGQLQLFINTFSKALLLFFALVNLRNAHSRNVPALGFLQHFPAAPHVAAVGHPKVSSLGTSFDVS
jgi:hypothetical protein